MTGKGNAYLIFHYIGWILNKEQRLEKDIYGFWECK